MQIKNVAVFCSSSSGWVDAFQKEAVLTAKILVGNKWNLVFGGNRSGLMGVLCETVLQLGGKVIGITVPQLMSGAEDDPNLIVMPTLGERKKKMFELSDMAIVLPGAIGTLDELTDYMVLNSIGLQHKRVYVVNVQDFFTPLLHFMENWKKCGFQYGDTCLKVIDSIEGLCFPIE